MSAMAHHVMNLRGGLEAVVEQFTVGMTQQEIGPEHPIGQVVFGGIWMKPSHSFFAFHWGVLL